jgi:hypothetical protein
MGHRCNFHGAGKRRNATFPGETTPPAQRTPAKRWRCVLGDAVIVGSCAAQRGGGCERCERAHFFLGRRWWRLTPVGPRGGEERPQLQTQKHKDQPSDTSSLKSAEGCARSANYAKKACFFFCTISAALAGISRRLRILPPFSAQVHPFRTIFPRLLLFCIIVCIGSKCAVGCCSIAHSGRDSCERAGSPIPRFPIGTRARHATH